MLAAYTAHLTFHDIPIKFGEKKILKLLTLSFFHPNILAFQHLAALAHHLTHISTCSFTGYWLKHHLVHAFM